jgi:micrococcal nuclease
MRRLTRRQRRAVAVIVTMLTAALVVMTRSRGGSAGKWALTRGTVRSVADGERVRLLDVDAPEMAGGTPALASASRAELARLIRRRVVRLERGPRLRDKYGRLLAYTFVEGEPGGAEVFVNARLVRSGAARAKTWGEPGGRWDEIVAAEADARDGRRGMWASAGASRKADE